MKKYNYKIKDLPKNFNLVGCKLNKQIIVSGWNKGFWMTDNYENYKNAKSTKVEPIFFKDFDEIKNWKVEVSPAQAIQIEKFTYEKRIKNKSS